MKAETKNSGYGSDAQDARLLAGSRLPVPSDRSNLYDNPLLKRPLVSADVKHMLLGHWGTTPGQNFIYVHLKSGHQKI